LRWCPFFAVRILAAAAIRRFGSDRVDAVFGGGCALGYCYLVAPSWVAADDPQTLAEAIMLGGLVSYISRAPDRIGLFRTAVLVTLGGFVKHNVVAIPLAITFNMAIRSPRRLSFWFGCCTGLAVSGLRTLSQAVPLLIICCGRASLRGTGRATI
jgi:hypothetical protein